MQRNFCYICGSKVVKKADYIGHCAVCKQDYYENPKPCVEIALFNDKGEILISERGQEPNKGLYDIPGGFVDVGETAEAAILREMNEELNLEPTQFSKPEFLLTYLCEYLWGKENYNNLIVLFVARLNGDVAIEARDDVASVKWVAPTEVDRKTLSIPRAYEIIQQAASKNRAQD